MVNKMPKRRGKGRPPLYSEAQKLDVLTLAASDPEMLIGEIAERTGVGYATCQKWISDAKENPATAQTETGTPCGSSVNEDDTLEEI